MKILIVTKDRPERQITLESIKQSVFEHALILSKEDTNDYSHIDCEKIYVDAANIGEKRQRAMDLSSGKFVMLDDDLKFRVRDEMDPKKFLRAEAADVSWIFQQIEKKLDTYAHVGLTDEFMCQHTPVQGVEGKRYNQVLGYNKDLFPNQPPKFRININEEHDFNLQLQSAGLVPFVFCQATKSAGRYDSKGGMSAWRTAELERAEHQKFADLWPDLVSIRPCKNQLSGVRVAVQWKKALKK